MMDVDLTVALIKATVQIDQPINEAKRMVGTGFLVSVPNPNGAPQIVLVTAAHVFEKMPAAEVRVGWRVETKAGAWAYLPGSMTIRNATGPTWYQHPAQDIAVIPVAVPDNLRDAAIPESLLGDEGTFATEHVNAGDEMMTLGYPHGLSANVAGFPILRAGRLASYPVAPSASYPTFLIDLTAVPGNSGGPVFMTSQSGKGNTFVAGVLIKQVQDDDQRLELGVVADAVFVRQTIELMLKAQSSGPMPAASLKVVPTAPAPMHTPSNSQDMTKGKASVTPSADSGPAN